MKKLLTTATAVVLVAGSASAATVTTSFGPANNQAGPMFGQSITVNVDSDLPDGSIPASVYVTELTLKQTGSATGINDTDVAYIHIYDAFAVDGSLSPTTIGNLITVSSSTVDFSTTGANSVLTWSFAGDTAIDKGTEYFYVLATNTTAATVGDSANLTTQGLRLTTGDPYSGGRAFRGNGTTSDWDAEFTLKTSTTVVPEPSSTALLGLGGLALIMRRRK